MSELSDELYQQIKQHCACGDNSAGHDRFSEALGCYWNAWDLLSDLRTSWKAATWILATIGHANFLSGDFAAGSDNLNMAMHCPEAIGNPFLRLRLGQCLLSWVDWNQRPTTSPASSSWKGSEPLAMMIRNIWISLNRSCPRRQAARPMAGESPGVLDQCTHYGSKNRVSQPLMGRRNSCRFTIRTSATTDAPRTRPQLAPKTGLI
jgi:hypothetical protein